MADSLPLDRNSNASLPPPLPPSYQSLSIPPPSPPSWCSGAVPAGGRRLPAVGRPPIRVTSEFDSETEVFFNKVSCKLLDGIAKLKLSFQNDRRGQVASSQLGLVSKHFSVLYDLESRNALLKGSFDLANNLLHVCATHDAKEQQGEVTMVTSLGDPLYKLKLALPVPSVALPRATLQFPLGELTVEERREEASEKVLSFSGLLKGQMLNGVCMALYKDDALNLKYCFKDENMTFIPSVALPSNTLAFAFKRQFSSSDKLSYWYNFDSNEWSAVYKHIASKDLKFKAGYDSGVRLGWASLWVGDEDGKAKTAPMKMKIQFMLQLRQDDIRNSVFMFRLKKRWDF